MEQLRYAELTDFQLCNELTSVKQRIIDHMKENHDAGNALMHPTAPIGT